MRLTETAVRSFAVAKLFRDNKDKINSVDYSSDGTTLISSSDDDSIVIYDCLEGVKTKQTFRLVAGLNEVAAVVFTLPQNRLRVGWDRSVRCGRC